MGSGIPFKIDKYQIDDEQKELWNEGKNAGKKREEIKEGKLRRRERMSKNQMKRKNIRLASNYFLLIKGKLQSASCFCFFGLLDDIFIVCKSVYDLVYVELWIVIIVNVSKCVSYKSSGCQLSQIFSSYYSSMGSAGASLHQLFSALTIPSSAWVKSFVMLNVWRICWAVLPLSMLATVLHATSNKALASK